MAISNVPSIRERTVEEQVEKIHKYLVTLKNEIEYELEMANSVENLNENELEGLMQLLGFNDEDITEWNKIKQITDELGNVIAEKLTGSINTAITNILNTTATVIFDEHGLFIHDQPTEAESNWAMRIGATGFMIAKEKIMHEDNESFEWDWSTFGTGEGFTADLINSGTINSLTLNACNILSTNITAGNITGVNMEACNLRASSIESTDITASSITGSEFTGNTYTGETFTGSYFKGGTFEGDEANLLTLNAGTINASKFNTGELNLSTFTAGVIDTSVLNACEINTGVLYGSEIYGGLISGAIVQSVGENGDGVVLKDLGFAVYAPGTPSYTTDPETGETITLPGEGIIAGIMMYDQNGADTEEEAKNRVFFGTQNEYALKLYSDADMSITAKGEIFIGNCRFMGTTNLGLFLKKKIEWVDDGCIIDDTYFLQFTDTAIKCLNTNETLQIVQGSGSIEALYNNSGGGTSE